MDLINEAKSIGESLYEVTLKISLDVNIKASNAYLIRTRQAGIFHIEGFDKDAVSRIAATTCPNILFPFARQHIADLILRGGFPQLLLAPVNFEAMYQQQLQAQQAPDPGVRH